MTTATTTTMASRLKLSIPLPDFLQPRRRTQSYDDRRSRSQHRQQPCCPRPEPPPPPPPQQQQQQQQQPQHQPQDQHHQPDLLLLGPPGTGDEAAAGHDLAAAPSPPPPPSRLGSVRAARDFLLDTILSQDRWRAHGALIRVDCPHTLAELHALGHLPRADGLAACRRLVRAPVIHDEVAQYLWAALSARARGAGDPAAAGAGGGDDDDVGAHDGGEEEEGGRSPRRRRADEAFLAHLDARFRFDRPASAPARDRRRRDSSPVSPRGAPSGRAPSRSGSGGGGGSGSGTRARGERASSAAPPRSASFAGMLGSLVGGLGKGLSPSDRGRLPRSL